MRVVKFKDTEPKFNKPAHPNPENLKEMNSLEDSVSQSLEEISIVFKQLQEIEQEIASFLDYYYGIIGAATARFTDGNITKSPDNDNQNQIKTLNDKLSNLFSKLIKLCNTGNDKTGKLDFSIDPSSNQDSSELEELVKIESYLSGEDSKAKDSPKDGLVSIYKELANLLKQIKAFKSDKVSFITPTSDIRRRVVWAKICYEDLISKIKKELVKQIPEKLEA